MKNQKRENEWEKEFEEKFEGYWRGQAIPDEIKNFIRQLLEAERNRVVKILKEII